MTPRLPTPPAPRRNAVTTALYIGRSRVNGLCRPGRVAAGERIDQTVPEHRRPGKGVTLVAVTAIAVTVGGFVPGSAVAEPKPTLPQARAAVATLQHQAGEAGEAANDLTGDIVTSQRKVAAINKALVSQQRQVDAIGRKIGALAVANYKQSAMTTTGQLLLADDPEQFLKQASTAQAFAAQQTAILRRYQGANGKLADLRASEQVELQTLAAVQGKQNELKAKITTDLAAAEKVLATLTDAERDRLAAEDAAEVRREQAEAEAERRRTSRDSNRPSDPDVPGNVPASGRAKVAVEYALNQIGDPYVWAAAGPDSFDCSGLTMSAWGKAGVSLSHSSKAQYNEGRRVSRADLQPGDLLFYYTPISHVSMYIGEGKPSTPAVPASRSRSTRRSGRCPTSVPFALAENSGLPPGPLGVPTPPPGMLEGSLLDAFWVYRWTESTGADDGVADRPGRWLVA